MKLAAAAPKYGWTDLVYSLVPTGSHFQEPERPAGIRRLGLDDPVRDPEAVDHRGALRQRQDRRSRRAARTRPSRPRSTRRSRACNSTDPFETQPALRRARSATRCRRSSTTARPTTRTTGSRRSRPTRATASRSSTPARSPTRCSRRSRTCACRTGSSSVVPDYPIQQYFGDYQHFVQNKAKEWGDICGADHHVCTFADYPGGNVNATPTGLVRTGATTRLNRFIDHYAQPPGNPSAAAAGVRRDRVAADLPAERVGAVPGRRAGRRRSRRARFSELAPEHARSST